jgi:hypothetical protein
MIKIDLKDKHIYKTKHDHIQTYMKNTFVIVELPYGTRGEEGKEKNVTELTISKYITSVQVEDIMTCIERGVGGKG